MNHRIVTETSNKNELKEELREIEQKLKQKEEEYAEITAPPKPETTSPPEPTIVDSSK